MLGIPLPNKSFSYISKNLFLLRLYGGESINSSNSSPFSSNSISITPKKGMLIMFPGHLYHEVLPGGDDCIRTTIAFNIG